MDENDEDGYLILTRRPNETLRIGENILLHVVSVGRNVRISIEAPEDQKILRSELLDRAVVQTEAEAEAPARRVAEAAAGYQADPPAAKDRQQPVVRYRRRRKLMTLDGSGQQTAGD